MNAISTVRVLPRVVIGGYFQAAKLPLVAVQRVVRQQDNEAWAPALAFANVQAQVESALGVALRDSALVAKGSLHSARVTELRKAATLEATAELKESQAAEQRKQREAEIAEQREEAARRAEQSKNDIERQAVIHEQKVQEKAAKKTAAARQTKAAQDKVIARQERAAKTKALAAESRALSVAKDAVETKAVAADTDDKIAESKAARSSK